MHLELDSKYEQQVATERLQVDLGVQRYRSEKPMPWRDAAASAKEEADLPPGKRLLVDSIKPVADALAAWIAVANSGAAGRRHTAVPYLEQIEPMQAAYIAARTIINGASLRERWSKIATSIGQGIERHLILKRFEDEERGLFVKVERQLAKSTSAKHRNGVMKAAMRAAKFEAGEWDAATRLRVGEVMYEMFQENTGLVETVTSSQGRKHRSIVRVKPTDACLAWLESQHARCELLAPIYMPMVVPPAPWTTPNDGGYLDRRAGNLALVKTRNRTYLEELRNVSMPAVYSAVNAIQNTPWRINKTVLDVMTQVWDAGESLGGLPAREDDLLPAKPSDIATNEGALKSWKGKAAKVYEHNARLRSKRLAMMQKIWLAEKFAPEAAIYFPHMLDFRGRVYPVVPFVHPQADDAGKALLEFAEGRPLGEYGGYWLAVHIANLFGVDKTSMDDRVQWVWDNEEKILDAALSTLDGKRFWLEADKPYCALAACIDWLGFKVNGEAHISHLPVAMDGSCSGIQHFSAMLRDPIGGAAVNLVPAAKPADIYTQVADVVQDRVDYDTTNPEAVAWKFDKVVRKITKQPTMTLSYGATKRGMRDQIIDAVGKLGEDIENGYLQGADVYSSCNYLSNVVYDSIGDVVVAARRAMDWLQQVARVASQDGLPIHWTAPTGFPVVQEYRVPKARKVECFFGGRRHMITLVEDGMKLDKRRQASGISPNFVHSLDAAHMMQTVNSCVAHGITSFAMIHDSFGTHAGAIDELGYILRVKFIEQYTPDVLAEFRKEIAAQLPPKLSAQLPPELQRGTLDLDSIMESEYFFA